MEVLGRTCAQDLARYWVKKTASLLPGNSAGDLFGMVKK